MVHSGFPGGYALAQLFRCSKVSSVIKGQLQQLFSKDINASQITQCGKQQKHKVKLW
jgi:hypothetical protein